MKKQILSFSTALAVMICLFAGTASAQAHANRVQGQVQGFGQGQRQGQASHMQFPQGHPVQGIQGQGMQVHNGFPGQVRNNPNWRNFPEARNNENYRNFPGGGDRNFGDGRNDFRPQYRQYRDYGYSGYVYYRDGFGWVLPFGWNQTVIVYELVPETVFDYQCGCYVQTGRMIQVQRYANWDVSVGQYIWFDRFGRRCFH